MCYDMRIMANRTEYFREYRKRNRLKLNAYARDYYKDPEKKAKHKALCRQYYIEHRKKGEKDGNQN